MRIEMILVRFASRLYIVAGHILLLFGYLLFMLNRVLLRCVLFNAHLVIDYGNPIAAVKILQHHSIRFVLSRSNQALPISKQTAEC